VRLLGVSPAGLSDLFGIEIAAHDPFVPPAPRPMRDWTTDDTDTLLALCDSGAPPMIVALLTGHRVETVRRWMSAIKVWKKP
jgi:hypothetical protein